MRVANRSLPAVSRAAIRVNGTERFTHQPYGVNVIPPENQRVGPADGGPTIIVRHRRIQPLMPPPRSAATQRRAPRHQPNPRRGRAFGVAPDESATAAAAEPVAAAVLAALAPANFADMAATRANAVHGDHGLPVDWNRERATAATFLRNLPMSPDEYHAAIGGIVTRDDLPVATTNWANVTTLFGEDLRRRRNLTFVPFSMMLQTQLTPAPPGPRTGRAHEHISLMGQLQIKLTTNQINAASTFIAKCVGIKLKYFERTCRRSTAYLWFESEGDRLKFEQTYHHRILEDIGGVWIESPGASPSHIASYCAANAAEIKRSIEDGVERHGLAYHPVGKPMSVERARPPRSAVDRRRAAPSLATATPAAVETTAAAPVPAAVLAALTPANFADIAAARANAANGDRGAVPFDWNRERSMTPW